MIKKNTFMTLRIPTDVYNWLKTQQRPTGRFRYRAGWVAIPVMETLTSVIIRTLREKMENN